MKVINRIRKILAVIATLTGLFAFGQVGINDGSLPPDNSSMLDVRSTNKGMLIPRMTRLQRNSISSPATGLMVFQTDSTPGFFYYDGSGWTPVAGSAIHYPGELYGGGVVFWTDHTGQHGLIVSMTDLSTSQVWSNVNSTLIGPSAGSDWDGQNNSGAIVAQPGHTASAAKLCLDYTNSDYGTGVYSDWYLPSWGEINHLGNHIFEVQKALESDGNPSTTVIEKTVYWTSVEYNNNGAWVIDTTVWDEFINSKAMGAYVRAIRAF